MDQNFNDTNVWETQSSLNTSYFLNDNILSIHTIQSENENLLLNKTKIKNSFNDIITSEEKLNSSSISNYLSESSNKLTLRKTSLCKYWLKGACTKLCCDFAHGDGELQSTPNIWKTTICKHWRIGSCPNGDTCRHAHGEEELQSINTCTSAISYSKSNKSNPSQVFKYSNSTSHLNSNSQSSYSNSLNETYKNSSDNKYFKHESNNQNLITSFMYDMTSDIENKDKNLSTNLKSLLQLVISHLLVHGENNHCNECCTLNQKLQHFLSYNLQNEETHYINRSHKNSDIERFDVHDQHFIQNNEFNRLTKSSEAFDTNEPTSFSSDKHFYNNDIYSILDSLNFFDKFESNFKNLATFPLNNSNISSDNSNYLSSQLNTTALPFFHSKSDDNVLNILTNYNKISNTHISPEFKSNSLGNDSHSTQGETRSTKFSNSDFSLDGDTTDEEANLNKHSLNTDFYLSLLYHNQFYK